MSVAFSCGLHGWMASGVPCPTCERQRLGVPSPLPARTLTGDQAVHVRLTALEIKVAALASAIEAATAGETVQQGSTEGESAVPKGDAQPQATQEGTSHAR
jgi:hypothetical protein